MLGPGVRTMPSETRAKAIRADGSGKRRLRGSGRTGSLPCGAGAVERRAVPRRAVLSGRPAGTPVPSGRGLC